MNNDTFLVNIYIMTLSASILYLVIVGNKTNFLKLSEETAAGVSRTSLMGYPIIILILSFYIVLTENNLVRRSSFYHLILIFLAIFGTLVLFDYLEVLEKDKEFTMEKTNQLIGLIVGSASIFYFLMFIYYEVSLKREKEEKSISRVRR